MWHWRTVPPIHRCSGVRLDTAHAHILLSDSATSESGLHLLDQAATTSQQYGMSHQFVSIRNIRRAFERAS
jgi:hypothetical protein